MKLGQRVNAVEAASVLVSSPSIAASPVRDGKQARNHRRRLAGEMVLAPGRSRPCEDDDDLLPDSCNGLWIISHLDFLRSITESWGRNCTSNHARWP